MVNQEEIDSFKKMWLEEFGEELSDEEVLQEAMRLLEIVRFLELPP